jgi:hypothetical protein
MDKQLDGWLSWTWAVRVERMPSAPYEQVARDVEGAVFDGLVRAFVDRGDPRHDQIRVSCTPVGADRLDVTIEVRSEHPDWRVGATCGVLQEIDRRFQITYVQDVPRSQVRPWYLAPASVGSG